MTSIMLGVLGLGGGELFLILSVLLLIGAVLVSMVAIAVLMLSRRVGRGQQSTPPVPAAPGQAPTAGEVLKPEYTNMAGTHFHKVNLSGADFDDVNLSNARFHNIKLSNADFSAADLGGASFRHIGPPPSSEGKQTRQRPVRFEEMMLCDSTFRKVDLSNVRISDCELTGMTVNGVLVSELLAAHLKLQNLGGTS